MKINLKIFFLLFSLFYFIEESLCQDTLEIIPIDIAEISIGCLTFGRLNSNYVIKTEKEYQELMKYVDPILVQKNICSGYSLPDIDFRKYTLLGQKTSHSGCVKPEYNRRVEYDKLTKIYTYTVEVTTAGLCKMAFFSLNFILVPIIMENDKFLFITKENNVKQKGTDEESFE